MVIGAGSESGFLSESKVRSLMQEALAPMDLEGKRVLTILPDATRTAPIPQMVRLLKTLLDGRVSSLDFIVALGTHRRLDDASLSRLTGLNVEGGRAGSHRVRNHRWDLEETCVELGMIPTAEIEEISSGRLSLDLPVTINRHVLDYDHLFICGPTFPHEVMGFSGGNKYLFPGISGPQVIDVSHWLGALLESRKIIGTPDTPMRRMINRAAALIDRPKLCFSMVVSPEAAGQSSLAGLFIGSPEEAYQAATDLSSRVHIVWLDQPATKVLSVIPPMYEDLWVAGKGMYKLEPVVADGGQLVIYAPHIDAISYSHGPLLEEIGYHVRDYFVKRWDEFKELSWGVVSHSTLVKGAGTYVDGIETPRVRVDVATRISPELCRKLNLGYVDPESVRFEDWMGRESEGILFVPKAGEMLYRLKE